VKQQQAAVEKECWKLFLCISVMFSFFWLDKLKALFIDSILIAATKAIHGIQIATRKQPALSEL